MNVAALLAITTCSGSASKVVKHFVTSNEVRKYIFGKRLNFPALLDIQWPKCFQLQGGFAPGPRCSDVVPKCCLKGRLGYDFKRQRIVKKFVAEKVVRTWPDRRLRPCFFHHFHPLTTLIIHHSHPSLKPFLFCKFFPPQPFLFFFQDSLHSVI